ncbi:NAD(P)/FAD-dependent oxidoreductase [Streptomyces sp. ME19-01-6]|uniref:NAD(P)/FAD-dependent oxidoreductase n=1 Tax=Streptomyces sp. ME19-01-6 TaxID=3028686 RepID=UPI0029A769D1|nr:FAD-dependent oxidoreductase [Streptomyces sp. ME19-01-6]MDX3228021.1 FAD-dependent oxidoreductase [Streptomyces sp. ME19-01-6]
MEKHDVLVLGAGYAGLLAALRLAPHARVTLVDPSPHFTERVRLHEHAAGRPDVTHPLRELLRGTGVTHLAARATGLDPAARLVTTDDGRSLPYDRLVYALGSRTAAPGERAFTLETTAELHKRLLDGPGELAVVGGGLTGIETAAEIAEAHPEWRVRLLTGGEIGGSLSAKGRAHVRATLAELGVHVEEGRRVAAPEEVDAGAVVWAASMTANTELAAQAGLALDAAGRIRVDPALRSTSHPEIYAAGDCAAATSPAAGALRMACATALPTASHAATSLIEEARGREPRALRFRFLVRCVSLGRRDGLVQAVRADDTPRELVLTSRAAARVKEQIVRSTISLMHLAARRPGAVPLVPWI